MEETLLFDIKGDTGTLDPRSKILITYLLIIGAAISLDYFQIFLYLILFIPTMVVFRPRLVFFKRIIVPMILVIIIASFIYLSIPSNKVTLNVLNYEREYSKFEFVLLIVYRYLIIVLFNYMLLHSESSHTDIIEALASFKLGKTMITILLLIKKISITISTDFQKMNLAAVSKGAFGKNPLRNVYVRILILGRTLARGIGHSEMISKSLTARGFHDEFSPTIRPWSSEGVTLTIVAAILFVNITMIPWLR